MEVTPYHGQSMERFFIDCCRTKLTREYLPKIDACVRQLTEEDLWWRAHESNNSIGNLMLHLSGNVRQWVIHHLGGEPFEREREKEFSQREAIPAGELLAQLRRTVEEADAVLARFPEKDLTRIYSIQIYSVTGLEAILHITEHFSYHVGQIVHITKLRTGADLKFYTL
ncbi:MAG: DUF1572 family protein [Bacteroidetes bacterium]|nr:DUF1572 family protein [Bacteroidota bacterium]